MSEFLVPTIIGIITAIGIGGGLLINGFNTYQKNKISHYQIMQDMQKEFNMIDKLDRETQFKQYRSEFVNLHEKIAHLHTNKIIPKEIISYFEGVLFQSHYTIYNHIQILNKLKKKYLILSNIVRITN